MSAERKIHFPQLHYKFADTEYLVEATDYEQLALWKEWRHKVKWEEDTTGAIYTIGHLDYWPICICFTWTKINGKRIVFFRNY